jgi:hypothetical protein
MNSRPSKSKPCQSLLLEIFPRIVTATIKENKDPDKDAETLVPDHQLNDFVEHALNLTSKYPQAFLSFGLLSLNQPKKLAPRASKYLSILAHQLKESIQK